MIKQKQRKSQMSKNDILEHMLKVKFLQNSFKEHNIAFSLRELEGDEMVAIIEKEYIEFHLYLTKDYVEMKEEIYTLESGFSMQVIFTEIHYDLRDLVLRISKMYDEILAGLQKQYDEMMLEKDDD